MFKLGRRQIRQEKHLRAADVWFSEVCCPLPPLTSENHLCQVLLCGEPACLKNKTNSSKSPLFLVSWVFSLSGLNAYLVFPVLLISEARLSLSEPTHPVQAAVSVRLAQGSLPTPALGAAAWLVLLKLLPPIPAMAI